MKHYVGVFEEKRLTYWFFGSRKHFPSTDKCHYLSEMESDKPPLHLLVEFEDRYRLAGGFLHFPEEKLIDPYCWKAVAGCSSSVDAEDAVRHMKAFVETKSSVNHLVEETQTITS